MTLQDTINIHLAELTKGLQDEPRATVHGTIPGWSLEHEETEDASLLYYLDKISILRHEATNLCYAVRWYEAKLDDEDAYPYPAVPVTVAVRKVILTDFTAADGTVWTHRH